MIKRVNFLKMTPDEWREQRRKTIGGSDAGTILGLNPYDSPYNLWCVKTGRIVPEDISDQEPIRLGHDLEQYVADRFMEATGKKLKKDNNFIYNTDVPFAHVQADRLVCGERAGFEAKTTTSYEVVKMLRENKYRDTWYAQCVHGLMVTGFDRWYLGVLVFGHGFYHFTIDRDEAEIAALMGAELDFWSMVKNDTPPPVDGAEATTDALTAIYGESNAETVDLYPCANDVEWYLALSQQIKELEKARNEVGNRVRHYLGNAGAGEVGDKYRVTWKTQSRRTFDSKRFIADHSDISDFDDYYKETTTRVLRVSEKEV